MAGPLQEPGRPAEQQPGYRPMMFHSLAEARAYLESRTGIRLDSARPLDFAPQIRALSGYLGEPSASALSRAAPLAIEVSPEFLHRFFAATGSGTAISGTNPNGLYITGTNIILMSSAAPMDTDYMPLHELAHLASHLNRRGRAFGEERAPPRETARQPPILEEGFADLIASRAMGGPAWLSYPFEALLVVAIEGIVGSRAIMEAFGSGDYRPLSAEVDRRLGAGTFDSMLAQGTGLEALRYLIRRDWGEPPAIDRERLRQDPIWQEVMGEHPVEDLLARAVPSPGSSN